MSVLYFSGVLHVMLYIVRYNFSPVSNLSVAQDMEEP